MNILLFATEGKQPRVFVEWSLKQLATFIFDDPKPISGWENKPKLLNLSFESNPYRIQECPMHSQMNQAGVVKSYFFENDAR